MLGNFVFDIDGTLAIAADYKAEQVEKEVKERFGDAFFEKYCLTACNYPHHIFPGYYALFSWLHNKGGKILFFSAGVEERNVELAEKMMKMALGEDLSGVSYQVFSRQHCIDTHGWGMPEEEKESYQSYHYGQRKKKLAGIVVPEAELSNTLLIEDDVSYMVKGEEYNFISLRYCYEYLHDEKRDAFTIFHRAYYLAGLFSTMFEAQAEKGITLIEAAKFVQIDSEGAELSRSFYYPSNKKLDYYLKGQKILSEIDPTLQFFYPIPENKENIERD